MYITESRLLSKGISSLRVPLFRGLHNSRINLHENPLGLPKIGSRNGGDGEAKRMSRGLPVKKRIANVDRVILVSSAKGGVGKSTVAANLALALQANGKRVGLLDADLFGPSIPRLLNLSSEPRLTDDGKLLPLSNYGIESMSMGYMISPDNAVVWRGLMVMKAMQQLLFEVEWSPLDYLVIDMPPGTGDTQLTISQQIKIDGAVIVTTPQEIALLDAVKGVTMYNKVHVPILGIVKNMAFYVCPHCSHEAHIFGTDSVEREAKRLNIEILGSIPLNEEISAQADAGKPIVVSDPKSPLSTPYFEIAKQVMSSCDEVNK
ncbi:uncharacterized protein PRCAT00005953001 [Priceomyces carsonii]|uniref:uncharacterized protein n=1 Tax=Priceomyces carsonii TaxID=28549 RepID=UPI002EDA76BD|nr:unnamed protein product [Priceomyces carsonii]